METALADFRARLLDEWLPTFCEAYEGLSPSGFKAASFANLDAFDAHWFLKAIDRQLVIARADGSFMAPQSKAKEYIFWNADKKSAPRPLTLWLEPVITVGAIARLYELHGWPIDRLGMQSVDYAFDLVCYADNADREVILSEVKKSDREVEDLVRLMRAFGHIDPLPVEPSRQVEKNAYRKVSSLRRSWPEVVWTVGPAGKEHVFHIEREDASMRFNLAPVTRDALKYPLPAT